MRKVKVVFFIDVLKEDFDGVSNTMHQIIARIPAHISPIFITPLPPSNPDFPFPVYLCPYIAIPFYKVYRFALPGRMKALKQILDDFSPDIVHWSTPSLLGRYAVNYGRRNGIPVVSIYHTHFPSYVEYYLWFIPWIRKIYPPFAKRFFSLYRKTDLVLAPTQSMQAYLISIGLSAGNIKIWPRGVDSRKFNPDYRDNTYFDKRVNGDHRKLLFVSRLTHYKETDTLIRFSKILPPSYKLIIVGDGPDRKRMEREMPDVVFCGKLTGTDLSKAFASADVFVFTSVTETFGNVILEAMASGLPVVSAKAGGPADIIDDGKTGFLVEPKDEDALLAKVTALLEDKKLYQQIQKSALAFARMQDWNKICDELFKVYDQLATLEK